jgi:hypothetical protein
MDFGVGLHAFFTFRLVYGYVVRLKRREVSLGAVCKYKVGGAAETETYVFVPNETSFHTVLRVGSEP